MEEWLPILWEDDSESESVEVVELSVLPKKCSQMKMLNAIIPNSVHPDNIPMILRLAITNKRWVSCL